MDPTNAGPPPLFINAYQDPRNRNSRPQVRCECLLCLKPHGHNPLEPLLFPYPMFLLQLLLPYGFLRWLADYFGYIPATLSGLSTTYDYVVFVCFMPLWIFDQILFALITAGPSLRVICDGFFQAVVKDPLDFVSLPLKAVGQGLLFAVMALLTYCFLWGVLLFGAAYALEWWCKLRRTTLEYANGINTSR